MPPGIDEYDLLWVFAAGVVLHAVACVRSRGEAVGIAVAAAVALGTVWLCGDAAERAFDLPLGATLLFTLAVAIAFRRRLIPEISPGGLLHVVALAFYLVHRGAAAAGAELPASVKVAGLLPGLIVALAVGLGALRWRAGRALAFAAYLVAMLALIVGQGWLDGLAALHARSGFSAGLALYVLSGGGIFLILAAHLVQLVMLLPVVESPGRRRFLDAVLGPPPPPDDAPGLRADRSGRVTPDLTAWSLLALHAALLALNARGQGVPDGLLVNLSLLVTLWLIMPWERRRRLAPPTAGLWGLRPAAIGERARS